MKETPREINNDKLSPRDIEVKQNTHNNSKKSLPLMTEPDASQRLGNETFCFPINLTKSSL